MSMTLIAGLGNPGPDYQWTRHNAGFMVLDRLSAVSGISVTKKGFSGFCGEGFWEGHRLILLKPQTFMNLSGRSVAEALRFYKLTVDNLIVVHDELDLPFGAVRAKKGGGHGGHNGLRSIIDHLKTPDFLRLRVGIDRPPHGDTSSYVLGRFGKNDLDDLAFVLDGACDVLSMVLKEGVPKAMSLYNSKNFLAKG